MIYFNSIKRVITFFMLAVCCVLIVSYSLLVKDFFREGLDLSVRQRLFSEVLSYSQQYALDKNAPLPASANFMVVRGYDSLPLKVRQRVPRDEFMPDDFIKAFSSKRRRELHYFVLPWKPKGEEMLYFMYSVKMEDMPRQLHAVFSTNRGYLFAAGVSFLLVICILALIMMHFLTKPVVRLNDWATQLSGETIDNVKEEFQYKELNQLAELIKSTMKRMLQNLEREKKFLRNASHELRTPVAVLQSNVELLERLGIKESKEYREPVQRIKKAAQNMKHLITTLLWVSKQSSAPKVIEEVYVDEALAEIVEQNKYLIEGKKINYDLALSPVAVLTHKTLARIVWNNVIRNAFQHTYEGSVEISLADDVLFVRNDVSSSRSGGEDESHSLGLMLIKELTDELGWDVHIVSSPEVFTVSVKMSTPAAQSLL